MSSSPERRRTTLDPAAEKRHRVLLALSLPDTYALPNRELARLIQVDESTIRRARRECGPPKPLPKSKPAPRPPKKRPRPE